MASNKVFPKLYYSKTSFIILAMINKLITTITITNSKFHSLNAKLLYSYSKPQLNHPIIDKIMRGQEEHNIQSFLPQLGALGDQNRQIALRLLLKKVYMNKLSISLLSNQKMVHYLNRHPEITVQANIFLIKQEMKHLQSAINKGTMEEIKEIKEIMGRINQTFVICFQHAKKIDPEKKLKAEVMLHKRFADYYLLYFSRLVEAGQRRQVLKKSRQFFKSSLNLMPQLIQEEKQKLQLHESSELKPGQKKQQHEFRTNSMRQNVRMLIETNSENVLHMFMAENELQQNRQALSLQQNIIGLLSYFQRAISYYQMYKNMKVYSIFYHRLNKTAAEINYYAKITAFRKFQGNPSKNEQFKQFEARMWEELSQSFDKLHAQTVDDIKQIIKSPKHMGSVQELSRLLLSIRIHRMNKESINFQDFKAKLLIEVQQILLLLEDVELRKITSSNLAKLVKQTIEVRSKQQEKNVNRQGKLHDS